MTSEKQNSFFVWNFPVMLCCGIAVVIGFGLTEGWRFDFGDIALRFFFGFMFGLILTPSVRGLVRRLQAGDYGPILFWAGLSVVFGAAIGLIGNAWPSDTDTIFDKSVAGTPLQAAVRWALIGMISGLLGAGEMYDLLHRPADKTTEDTAGEK